MVEEIRQDGRVILSSEDGFSVPMIFNNLCGKNFLSSTYKCNFLGADNKQ